MTTDDYNKIIAELMDELPQDFFRKLNGGVIVSDSIMVPDYAKADDLYAMGQYLVYSGIRQIVMYKGSFDRVYPNASSDEAKSILRSVLRHEFRHHLESLGGIFNSDSLKAEDDRKKAEYLSRHSSGTSL